MTINAAPSRGAPLSSASTSSRWPIGFATGASGGGWSASGNNGYETGGKTIEPPKMTWVAFILTMLATAFLIAIAVRGSR
jgi:hypothetical protein